MEKTERILLVIPHMVGGGAERVASLLMNSFADAGYRTEMALTGDRREDVIRCDLDERTELLLVPELTPPETAARRLFYDGFLKTLTYIVCKPFEYAGLPVPAECARLSLTVQYRREIRWLRERMLKDPSLSVISFLQPAIPISLLAAVGLPNRVIFSERGDAQRLMKKRYGRKFVEKYYRRADAAVFQTEFARDAYPAAVACKGRVIPNPLRGGLPVPFDGERKKRISTFCRISRQKNLPLLVEAFSRFYIEHPEYTLRIIGGGSGEEGEAVESALREQIRSLGLTEAVRMEPFSKNVHEQILEDAMYVNSSDFEGLSNAMLESMAIGLPVICTDCPVGGARATIEDRVNGLLVPMNDPEALCAAMKRLAEDPRLAQELSENARKLRETCSLSAIAARWMELLK